MYKEIIISIAIIIFILVINKYTADYTNEAVEIMSEELTQLKQNVLEENPNKETIESNIKKIEEKWGEKNNTLACYIEHDELEKINTEMTSIKSFIEVEDYKKSIENIDKCNYIIEHLKEKEVLSIINIF